MFDPMGIDTTDLEDRVSGRTRPEGWEAGEDPFAAAPGSSKNGRLRFTNGAHRVAVRTDLLLRGLYRARFGDRAPTVGVRGGVVSIRYPRFASRDWPGYWSELPAEVALNARIPWDIVVRGGASRLLADLRTLELVSFRVSGGISGFELVLSRPSGTVPVIIRGGASNVAVRRPRGVAARLRVGGGATDLTFDSRRIGVAGRELDLRSRDYDGATGRYDVVVTGGANHLSIGKQRGLTEGADLDREG